jgi:hypothetical protein
MFPVNFHGENVHLLPFLADWSQGISLTLSIDAEVTRSLGGIESREAGDYTLRAALECALLLRRHEAGPFTAALRLLADSRVLMPLWPLAHRLNGTIVYTDSEGNILTAPDGAIYSTIETAGAPALRTGIWLTVEPLDFTRWAVHETLLPGDGELAGSQTALRVPLMLGYFDKIVEPRPLNGKMLSAELKFIDSAPAPYAPRVEPPVVFDALEDGRPAFPFAPNWAGRISTSAHYEIKRRQIGQGRAPVTTYYPQPAARTMQATFTCVSLDGLSRMVSFFHQMEGVVGSFHARHAIDGDLLVRFAKPSLVFDFASGRIAHAKIGLIELPHEAAPPAGEVPGGTMGAMPPAAQLFRFTRRYPGATVVDRFTGFARAVTAGGELFLNRAIEHGDITDSVSAEGGKVKITSDAFEGNPLLLFEENLLEVPLELEILEAYPDAAGNAPPPELLFKGVVGKPDQKGMIITGEVKHWMSDLLRNVPDSLVQGECNYELFSPKPACGVPLADWTFTATVAGYDGHVLTLAGITRTNGAALPAIGPGAFAFGRIWFGQGTGFQTRSINDNSSLQNGELTLTVSHPFNGIPSGLISFHPGCPGTPEACMGFNNYQRIGAFPHVPNGNPAWRIIKDEPSGGKK